MGSRGMQAELLVLQVSLYAGVQEVGGAHSSQEVRLPHLRVLKKGVGMKM